jgi:hypothetical protein
MPALLALSVKRDVLDADGDLLLGHQAGRPRSDRQCDDEGLATGTSD